MTQEQLLLRKIALALYAKDPSMNYMLDFSIRHARNPVAAEEEEDFFDSTTALNETHDILEKIRDMLDDYAEKSWSEDPEMSNLIDGFDRRRDGHIAQLREFEPQA